jgi:hypothetical protein
MILTPLSGCGGKAPAAFLVESHGRRLLLDLGEGPEPGVYPDLSGVGTVDAVLISHGHVDHMGGLKLLPRIGDPPVYATATVAALHPQAPVTGILPLGGACTIAGVAVETGRASHAPGGVWMRLGGPDGVLYTGDWTTESSLYPLDPMPAAATLVCDCSYGRDDRPLADGIAALAALAAAGPLFLPLPPDGRGLEIALDLLERGHQVTLCPEHRRVAACIVERFPDTVVPGGVARLRRLLDAALPLEPDTPARGVMIAAGAAAESPLAEALATRFGASGAAAIALTGHVPDGTPAAELKRRGAAHVLRWNVHPRLSDVTALLARVRPHRFVPAFVGGADLEALLALSP